MDRREFLRPDSSCLRHALLKPARLRLPGQLRCAPWLAGVRQPRHALLPHLSSHSTTAQVVALPTSFADKLDAGRSHFDQLNASSAARAIDEQAAFPRTTCLRATGSSPRMSTSFRSPPLLSFTCSTWRPPLRRASMSTAKSQSASTLRQAKQALEIAKRVKPTQSVDVGFQCRNAPPIAAIAEKIKAGALGKIAAVAGNYYAPASDEKVRPGASPDEYRLRNWLWYRAFSGDILVEQNIHIIDLCNWMLGAHPLKATATGGRNILTHAGDCWDNYQVDFTYPGRRPPLVCVHAVRQRMAHSTPASGSSAPTGRRPFPTPARCRLWARNPGPGGLHEHRRGRASSPPTALSLTIWPLPIATRSAPSSTASSPASAQPDCRRRGDRIELHARSHGRLRKTRSDLGRTAGSR